jgi:hypothetical protein
LYSIAFKRPVAAGLASSSSSYINDILAAADDHYEVRVDFGSSKLDLFVFW